MRLDRPLIARQLKALNKRISDVRRMNAPELNREWERVFPRATKPDSLSQVACDLINDAVARSFNHLT